jgi:cyclic-di-GMP phosphodiesterase TipF (flagellum assembly factor)
MTRLLITATYLLFSATVGIAVYLFAGASTGFLAGVVLALGSFQIHANRRHRRARRITDGEIAGLKRRFEMASEELHARIDDINKVVESRAFAQHRKIVSELQSLEGLMHDFAAKGSESRAPIKDAAAPILRGRPTKSNLETPDETELLETIRNSLEQSRVDLYLQPIVSLPQRKLRFYEALSRLRAEDGSIIMPARYIEIAAPAGLMPLLDNLLLFRCVQIVRRLTQKQRDIGIFCNISGASLIDAAFFPQFLEFMHRNRDLAGQIVFEFAQEDMQRGGAEGEAGLASLASLGFALSLDHVDSLEIDFTKLRKLGFRHIKVRAARLTRGMENAPVDLKKLLERHGLNLIAERVEDEGTVRQLLDFGVDYAQGYLFGGPRAVRDDSLRAMEKEAATAPIVPFRKAS